MSSTPPNIRELLRDPVYKAYATKTPRLPAHYSQPATVIAIWPWQIWALSHKGVWRTATFPTYREGFTRLVELAKARTVKNPDKYKYDDVALVCRPILHAPPPAFQWDYAFDWCGRCRRPTAWSSYDDQTTHHALAARTVLTEEDPYRCVYCGIRRVAQPVYPMGG